MKTPEEIARTVLNSIAASDPDSLTAAFADSLRTYAESQVNAAVAEREKHIRVLAEHSRNVCGADMVKALPELQEALDFAKGLSK